MKKLTIRLPDETNEALGRLAQAQQRSVNKHVVWLIEQAIKADELTPEVTPQEKTKRGVKTDKPRSGTE
jgi:predicted transcriptional regulator